MATNNVSYASSHQTTFARYCANMVVNTSRPFSLQEKHVRLWKTPSSSDQHHFFQAAYQYFSSGTFYVQGLAPGLPTAVLCIDIANGVRWYGRGSSIRRENQIMLIFLNEIAPDYCSAQKDNVPSHVLPLNLPQLLYALISQMGCNLRVVGAILVARIK